MDSGKDSLNVEATHVQNKVVDGEKTTNEEAISGEAEEKEDNKQKSTRKFDLGNIILPYTAHVRTSATSNHFCLATLDEINDDEWTGSIKCDSTKDSLEVLLLESVNFTLYNLVKNKLTKICKSSYEL